MCVCVCVFVCLCVPVSVCLLLIMCVCVGCVSGFSVGMCSCMRLFLHIFYLCRYRMYLVRDVNKSMSISVCVTVDATHCQ